MRDELALVDLLLVRHRWDLHRDTVLRCGFAHADLELAARGLWNFPEEADELVWGRITCTRLLLRNLSDAVGRYPYRRLLLNALVAAAAASLRELQRRSWDLPPAEAGL